VNARRKLDVEEFQTVHRNSAEEESFRPEYVAVDVV